MSNCVVSMSRAPHYPVVLVDTAQREPLSLGIRPPGQDLSRKHVIAFSTKEDAKRFAIAARVLRAIDESCTNLEALAIALDSMKGFSPENSDDQIHQVTGLLCIALPPDLLMRYCSDNRLAVYFAGGRPEADVIIHEGVFRSHHRGGDIVKGWDEML
eukprot:jgi/Mesvir1/25154/Mv18834-RA.1